MKGKLIVIEGTDCSGKETQTKLLVKFLEDSGEKVFSFSCESLTRLELATCALRMRCSTD